ncbi:hypothetical protein BN2475_450053 [Paraburkholderia ribeironis]|uniref:Uncharacterized protein n=1 Tax=Paraburkholderia ribeironis TaxID=1247936 RepID=A0A1N7S9Y7_9BURK|nr:hypothetical protein BN2475_450053 [Paraburkholderia ribeironis]
MKCDDCGDGSLPVHTVNFSGIETMARQALLQCFDIVATIALLKHIVLHGLSSSSRPLSNHRSDDADSRRLFVRHEDKALHYVS